MAFYDVVAGMGYKVSNTEEVIDISKEDDYALHKPLVEIHIVFYKKDKEIIGFLKPLRDMFDQDDMSHMYKAFLDMQKDLKTLSEMSKYKII